MDLGHSLSHGTFQNAKIRRRQTVAPKLNFTSITPNVYTFSCDSLPPNNNHIQVFRKFVATTTKKRTHFNVSIKIVWENCIYAETTKEAFNNNKSNHWMALNSLKWLCLHLGVINSFKTTIKLSMCTFCEFSVCRRRRRRESERERILNRNHFHVIEKKQNEARARTRAIVFDRVFGRLIHWMQNAKRYSQWCQPVYVCAAEWMSGKSASAFLSPWNKQRNYHKLCCLNPHNAN